MRVVAAFAASLGVTPSSSTVSVGSPVAVSLVIDGNGTAFNAAQATVAVSGNLSIANLTLGDCNFSYITTPAVANPSFIGAILGGSSTKCTVYTLTLLPQSGGNGTVTITNAKVKSYPRAQEILSSVQNGSYSVSTSTSQASVTPYPQLGGSGTTGTSVSVVDASNMPVKGAVVTLTSPDKGNVQATTGSNGTALFTPLPSGVYDVSIADNGKKIADNVVTVPANGSLHLAYQKPAGKTGLWIFIILILVLAGIIGVVKKDAWVQLSKRILKK